MQKIITEGSRAVVINQQDSGHVWACLYVNARNGIVGADITDLRWSGAPMKGAERWAAKQLKV